MSLPNPYDSNDFFKPDSSLVKKRTLPPLDPTLSHEQQIKRNLNSYLSYLDTQNPLVRTLVQPEINIPTRPEYNIPVKRRFSEATLKANLRRVGEQNFIASSEKVCKRGDNSWLQRFSQTVHNTCIANFVLDVPLEMNKTNEVCIFSNITNNVNYDVCENLVLEPRLTLPEVHTRKPVAP